MATKNEIEKPKVRLMEVVLNKFLKKYDWFKKIEIDSIGYSEGAEGHFAIDGTIFVDEDWLYNQWREYNYSAPFPDLNDKDLGDFVGGDLSKKLRDEFIMLFVAVTELKKPRYISWSWIKIRTEEEEMKNLRESIRKVLKENKVKDRLEKLIDNVGFNKACKSVGGVRTIAKVMGMDVAELLNTYFVGEKLSTDDMRDAGIGVGGYDFKFTPIDVSKQDERIVFNYAITEGKVSLIAGTGETFDLMDERLRRKDYWWEVEYEILDLFILYSIWLLEDLNYDDKEEDVTPIIEFDFRPKI
jgi:hypothetical protein